MTCRTILFSLCLSASISSCSDHLTNSQAENLIKEKIHFPVIEDEVVETGLVAWERDSLPQHYYVLQSKGMLNIQALGPGGLFTRSYRFRIELAPAAKEFITAEDQNPTKQGNTGEAMYHTKFKTCEVNFEKIESVQEIPSMNTAEVKYQVRRSKFTPFWSVYLDGSHRMPDTLQTRPYKLIKTADGWKADH